ncbi:MAG: type I-E CRISPR-associated protein Cas7/Cse4/CasC [Desulfobacula sp.]|jgi:CRISPR system Cascade subunit CasC
MKHLELHVLQSIPASCLNRDDMNSPKTAFFGGVQRARVSSQSWKRAIREYAKELSPYFKGERTRLIVNPLKDALITMGLSEVEAIDGAKKIADALAKFDAEVEKKTGELKVKTLYFTSPGEIKALAESYAGNKDPKKALKSLNAGLLKDAADISIFGRMVASDHSLTIEGASMFSQILSTHRVDNEIDFFSAVDDLQGSGDAGAGMTGTLEFNSATYYRFAALNLDLLFDKFHLGTMTVEERKEILSVFIQSVLEAVPQARKNSMNGFTRPGYVIGLVRSKGHPVQLVNAFEKPVWAPQGKGIMEQSIEALEKEVDQMDSTWKLKENRTTLVKMPEKNIKDFIQELVNHAV